jgi:cytochrome b involved in lipid metabolism
MRSKTTQRLLELSSGLMRSTVIFAFVLASMFTTSQSSHASVSDSNAPQKQTTGLNTPFGQFPNENESKIGMANTEATYTLADVAVHNTQADCWTLVFDKVYNITTYIKNHPGGASSIAKICGKDGTAIFDNKHGGSSSQALILSTYKIGVLAKPVVKTCTAGNFYSDALSKCTPAPKGYFVSATSAAAGATSARACPAGKFTSGTGSTECQVAPKGFFVPSTASSSATACPTGFTTLASASTLASDCYRPIVQTIPGLSAPKALKYKGTVNLPITTNSQAIAAFKTSGPCSAKLSTVTTKKNGKSESNKVLKVTAASQSGTCKITLTSLARGKYLGMSKTVVIRISGTGK